MSIWHRRSVIVASSRRERPWVLVSGPDSSRAAIAAVRVLAAAGYHPAVTVSGRASLAGASRSCERRVVVPSAELDPGGYAAAITAELDRHPYLTVLPGSDAADVALGRPEARLMDKVRLASLAREAGLDVPPTTIFESYADLIDAADSLPYPVIVKPGLKRFMAQRADRRHDLARVPDGPGQLIVQPYIQDQMHGVIGLTWHGRLRSAVHFRYERIWPQPAGTVAFAVTVPADPALDARFERLLGDHDGVFHADMIGPYLLDLNPRIHAAIPLAAAAGANVVTDLCALLEGEDPAPSTIRAGVRFRWIEGDLRSLVHGFRRGRISLPDLVRAARPRRGVVHGYESLRDPGPLFERLKFLGAEWDLRGARRREMHDREATVDAIPADEGR